MFVITYHKQVVGDIKNFPKPVKVKVRQMIERKLTEKPEIYGKPLRGSLKGFRSLRIGEHRVIFIIEEDEVFIVMIAHRSRIYGEAEKRIDR